MAKELTLEQLRIKVNDLTSENERLGEELKVAKETTQKLIEKNTKLQELNTDLFARTVAGSEDLNPKQTEVVSYEDATESLLKKLKNYKK